MRGSSLQRRFSLYRKRRRAIETFGHRTDTFSGKESRGSSSNWIRIRVIGRVEKMKMNLSRRDDGSYKRRAWTSAPQNLDRSLVTRMILP
jgi:hypothetical protein